MTKLIALTLLLICAPVVALGVTPESLVDATSPASYYPTVPGLAMQFESTLRTDEASLQKSVSRVVFREFGRLDGVPTWTVDYSVRDVDTDDGFSMVVYQQVDHGVSQTRAFEFPGTGIMRESQLFVDLKSPLVDGGAWQHRSALPHHAGEPRGPIEWDYETVVEETGLAVTTAAGEFTDCIKLRDVGRSVAPVTVQCPDGTVIKTRVLVDRIRYFAPTIGNIKESSVEKYGADTLADDACLSFHFSVELTDITAAPAGR